MSFYKVLASEELSNLFKIFREKNIKITVVGGASRDILLYNKLSSDIDCEISFCGSNCSATDYESIVAECVKKSNLTYRYLRFGIVQFILSQHIVEFSPPRKEMFLNSWPLGHGDFNAEICWDLDFKDCVKRRDFTLNAIGFDVVNILGNEVNFLLNDPLNGYLDLKKKVLNPCSQEIFYFDPVRLLRLIRFKHLLNAELSDKILDCIALFNLEKITPYYIWGEAFKSNSPGKFLKELIKIVDMYELKVSADFVLIKKISEILDENYFSDKQDFINSLSIYKNALTKSEWLAFAQMIGVKNSVILKIVS